MEPATWTITILCIGILVVVGGILALKLHAFLALTFGALAVALLTPQANVEQHFFKKSGLSIAEEKSSDGKTTSVLVKGKLKHGEPYLLLSKTKDGFSYTGQTFFFDRNVNTDTKPGTGLQHVQDVVVNEAQAKKFGGAHQLADGDMLIPQGMYLESLSKSKQTIAARVAGGFGSTAAKIGILIAMASIVGKCLLDSGAADKIVRTALRFFGEKFAPASFVFSGFLLGIPVFFDTVFYLMIPLGKAMQLRTGRNYLFYVLSICAGATMAHSLVPPTPGPLLVAEQLNVEIGTMILGGMIVGFFCATFGYFYASIANRIWTLPIRESADFSLEDLEKLSSRDESELPPFWLSILPILLPVFLIGGKTLLKSLDVNLSDSGQTIVDTFGDKNIALIISAVIAMATLIWKQGTSRKQLAESVGASLASGGTIILITSAGGAFGGVLQQTGVASLIEGLSSDSPAVIITMAFLITAAVRTAQGSATVAMITAVGILSGLAQGDQLAFHPVYLALAIGCGSKPIAWMNDSGFWVITRMSGMTEGEGLKYVTPMTTLMGLVGLGVTILGAMYFPEFGG
jgi:gluconate:H+ symporter, GntP family